MGIFDLFRKAAKAVDAALDPALFAGIIDAAHRELTEKHRHYWDFKANTSSVFNEQLLPLTDKEKLVFILQAIQQSTAFHKTHTSYGSEDRDWQRTHIWNLFMDHLLKTKLVLEDADIDAIIQAFYHNNRHYTHNIFHWPIALLLTQVEKQVKARGLSPALETTLTHFKQVLHENNQAYYVKEQVKLAEKIDGLLFAATNGTKSIKPTWFMGNDAFASFANASIEHSPSPQKDTWFKLMQLSKKGSASSPSAKFLTDSRQLVKELGDEHFKHLVQVWFQFITNLKETVTEHVEHLNGRNYTYHSTEFLSAPNIDMVKGFVWMCSPFHNKTTLLHIAQLAERCFRKIPGKGPAAMGIGNACLYVLAHVKGLDGVSHLSRLRLRIKQSSTQALIEKYLNQAAAAEGVSIHEIEDMAVDDYGLTNGERSWELDGFKAILTITGSSKTSLNWFKPDGSPQKAVPTTVKEKHAAKLKKIKDTVKEVELTLSAQRDRIDRMLRVERLLSWPQFTEYYMEHGLMCYLAHKIIWVLKESSQQSAAIFQNGQWVTPNGALPFVTTEETTVKLWHPVFETVADIQAWRDFLIQQQLVQPLKQAFREVYLLTDAELHTNTYSNRMAAHILKQHQFNSLAKTRGWKYSLMGCFDNGIDNGVASLSMPEVGLSAEYWVNEVNAENAMNDTGIWSYVATDQVRFTDIATREAVDLVKVPALNFSEAMRDVDLFVGVASVGNDPAWRDNGGLPAYRDYWQSYSFGELTEVAKTRKSILEKLIPRLKIAALCSIQDKFLIVKGKLRTYKIHIGSTNILMEPNDQYLCIVPDRSAGTASTSHVFLPFEGDNGISVIISKALLLAADDAITDTSITSQINRT